MDGRTDIVKPTQEMILSRKVYKHMHKLIIPNGGVVYNKIY